MKSIFLFLFFVSSTLACQDPAPKPQQRSQANRVLSVFNGVVGPEPIKSTVLPSTTSTSVPSTSTSTTTQTTTTLSTTTTTPTTTTPKPCTIDTPASFLFGFSNDVEASVIKETIKVLKKVSNVSPRYTSFGCVRFDDGKEKKIQYHKTASDLLASAESQLPDPSLRSSNKSIGSDMLVYLNKFVNNTEISVCGSKVLFIIKRFANELTSGDLIPRLKDRHVTVNTISPPKSSGGLQQESIYEIVTKTFGMGLITDTEQEIPTAINDFNTFAPSFLIYANSSTQVGFTGLTTGYKWSDMHVPRTDQYYLAMSVQDRYPIDNWKESRLEMQERSTSITSPKVTVTIEKSNYFISQPFTLNAGDYGMEIFYNYSVGGRHNNQHTRIYSRSDPEYWTDFGDCCFEDGTVRDVRLG